MLEGGGGKPVTCEGIWKGRSTLGGNGRTTLRSDPGGG